MLIVKKDLSISNNPNVALNFHWKSLLKQIRIEGVQLIRSLMTMKQIYITIQSRMKKVKLVHGHQNNQSELI